MFSLTANLINSLFLLNEIGFKHASRKKFRFLSVILNCKFSAEEKKRSVSANSSELFSSEKYEYVKKSIKVAFIGYPNVGKSTLINALTGLKICAASKKPHTTQRTQRAFILRGDTEMILLDTPGVVSKRDKNKFSLSYSFNLTNLKELKTADLVGVVCDSSNLFQAKINTELKNLMLTLPCHTDFILILNKIDVIKDKRKLLKLTETLLNQKLSSDDIEHKKKICRKFSRVFMISALNNDGIEDIAEYICSLSNVSKENITSERITDHKDEELIAERVKAALLDNLADEIPYKSSCEVEFMHENTRKLNVVVLIKSPKKNYRRIIEGKGNRRLDMIRQECERDLTELFKKPVFLKLVIVVPKTTKNIQ